MTDKITSAEIRAALNRRYVAPESAVVFEVAQGTGHHAHRHLDAIAMELWPSRGLALHGIEIKVDLYDFRRERTDPTKAEQVARFCDYFWIAAPAGVVPLDELPTAWGLLELQSDDNLKITKQPIKTDSEPVSRLFMAAMLRAATRPIDGVTLQGMLTKERREMAERHDQAVKDEGERLTRIRHDDSQHWQALIAALGKDPLAFVREEDVIATIKLVSETGVARTYGGIRQLQGQLEAAAAEIKKAADALNIPVPTSADVVKSRINRRKRRAA